ncbi:hypothetical protein EJB05_17211, partial [Eragrostis curvula]
MPGENTTLGQVMPAACKVFGRMLNRVGCKAASGSDSRAGAPSARQNDREEQGTEEPDVPYERTKEAVVGNPCKLAGGHC